MAETQHRDALIAIGRLGEKLRRDMLLELLTVEKRQGIGPLALPSDADLKKIPEMRRGVDGLANILGLPVTEVAAKVGGFLDIPEAASAKIPKGADISEIFENKDGTKSSIIDAVINWSVNAPDLRRIKRLSDKVEDYNRQVSRLQSENDRYVGLLSNFLRESNKEIIFNERGYIQINLLRGSEKIPISSLSSGESQIFVILSHLFFNSKAKKDNVFIIDEPELSLHVQWQELFVESIISANPHIQYIMATHSPSIILDRVESCVDMLTRPRPAPKGKRRG
ncbi:MAG: hypothetical protein EOP04_15615 [Proteobacteria bacterium]|nr:MAG: hypothetical protein EOP04_15615 [Pseudomonadota bacterium]